MKSYKINDVLYRRASLRTLEYCVKGVRDYGDSKQYELECQSCNHGERCRVLAAFDDYKKLRIVHMLHDDEEYICEQRAWHCNSTPFHETIDAVRREMLLADIECVRNTINKHEEYLASSKKQLASLENSLAIIEDELQKGV